MSSGSETVECVGVIGAGAMGSGIAQVTITGGMQAIIFDQNRQAVSAAIEQIGQRLDRLVEKQRLSADDAAAAKARLHPATRIADLSDCQLVVEAIVEKLEAKQAVFVELEQHVAPDTVLASNTSSLSIAAIASACQHRGRVAGMHFFNPVPLMKLVEVISGPDTRSHVAAMLADVARRMERIPVKVADSPGFLVNLGGRAFNTEALHLLREGVASPAQIDAVMRDCCAFRMGPFELMDLTGIDVNYPVSTIIHQGFFFDPRLRTTPHHRQLHESGRLGRKSGRGFYAYGAAQPGTDDDNGTPADHPTNPEQAADAVFLAEADERLADLMQGAGCRVLDTDDGHAPIVTAPLGEDASTVAARLGLPGNRLVAVDTLTASAGRVVIMTPPGGDPGVRDAVAAALATTGRAVTAIHDSPGFIAQRICAMVANLGCEMAQIGLADPGDIDKAMTLGLNYPAGPLALCERHGKRQIYTIMQRLQAATGDDRYRPSSWLRRRAQLGLPIHRPD